MYLRPRRPSHPPHPSARRLQLAAYANKQFLAGSLGVSAGVMLYVSFIVSSVGTLTVVGSEARGAVAAAFRGLARPLARPPA